MAQTNRHVIRKASLEVNGAGTVDAFRFQQEAVTWAHDQLLPELERAFASLPDMSTHVVLDRLEIELDASDAAHWGSEILPRLKVELAAALIKSLMEGGQGKSSERLPADRSIFRKLAHYLEHGVLPWNFEAATPEAFETEIISWLASDGSREMAAELAGLFRQPSIRTRFLQTFRPSLILQILIRIFRMPSGLAKEWAKDAALLPLTAYTRSPVAAESEAYASSFPVALFQEILGALSHNPRLFEFALEEEIIQAYLGRMMLENGLAVDTLKALPFASSAFAISRERIFRQVPGPCAFAPPSELTPPAAQDANPSARLPDPGPAAVPASRPEDIEPAVDPAVEGIYIHNAGLILLAPFLTMLFERLDLAKGGEMKDAGTAMALQHYLVTGQEGPVEFLVALPKVLCGWPLEKSIALPGSLSESMKVEAGQLLESVIGHWGILKNTSVEGLRESFLQRQGKLSRTAKGDWLLQVEQRAYDMLLQQLPWSFNLIRLPWMKNVLRTEWVE